MAKSGYLNSQSKYDRRLTGDVKYKSRTRAFIKIQDGCTNFCAYCIVPLVRYNWGDDAAAELCPYITLSDVAPEDVVAVGNMIANLARQPGLIHPSQYPGIDQKLGLPERDFASQMAEMNAANQRAQEIAHNAFGVGVLPGD